MSHFDGQVVLILGANSAIARGVAAELAARGASLALASRDQEELELTAQDLRVRYGRSVTTHRFEALDYPSHAQLVPACLQSHGRLDGVVLAFGELGAQKEAEADFLLARRTLDVNFTGALSTLTQLSNHLEAQGSGFIVGISSVAGERARASNYAYGCAKAALTALLSGLRGRLHRRGVRVLTVKPGFVDTPMTFGLKGMFLVAAPARVGRDIVNALEQGRDVVYTPWFWQWIMMALRYLPEGLFKRLKA